MSASAAPSASTTKLSSSNPPTTSSDAPQKQPAALEEDDEFEDFPVEGGSVLDWPQEETEEAAQGAGNTQHLWEESWDDDDTSEDFSKVLKQELEKVKAGKGS